MLLSEAASTSFHTEGWQVYSLGDMSTVQLMFCLTLIYKNFCQRSGNQEWRIMTIVVFSSTEEGLKFFAESVNTIVRGGGTGKGKFRRNLHLALYGKVEKNTKIKADLLTQDIETVLQWSKTTFESSVDKRSF